MKEVPSKPPSRTFFTNGHGLRSKFSSRWFSILLLHGVLARVDAPDGIFFKIFKQIIARTARISNLTPASNISKCRIAALYRVRLRRTYRQKSAEIQRFFAYIFICANYHNLSSDSSEKSPSRKPTDASIFSAAARRSGYLPSGLPWQSEPYVIGMPISNSSRRNSAY